MARIDAYNVEFNFDDNYCLGIRCECFPCLWLQWGGKVELVMVIVELFSLLVPGTALKGIFPPLVAPPIHIAGGWIFFDKLFFWVCRAIFCLLLVGVGWRSDHRDVGSNVPWLSPRQDGRSDAPIWEEIAVELPMLNIGSSTAIS